MTGIGEGAVLQPVGRSMLTAPSWVPPLDPDQGTNPTTIIAEIHERSQAIDRASNALYQATIVFEGGWVETQSVDQETGVVDTHRDYWEGASLRFDVAVTEAVEEIAEEFEKAEKKIPAADRLRKKAEVRVRAKQRDLWDEYHALETQVKALQKWLSSRKATLNSRQSILSAERELAR